MIMIGGQRAWLLASLGFCSIIALLAVFRPHTPLEPYIQQAAGAGRSRFGFSHDSSTEQKVDSPPPPPPSDGRPEPVTSLEEPTHPAVGKLEEDVYNTTLGFEKIYVINLPDRTDHKDELVISGSLLDIHFDFIPGIRGKDVPDKALPPPGTQRKQFGEGNVGSWRAHIDALQKIVHNNLGSALICEDDIDFDIRLKDQLSAFAGASHALTQPLLSAPQSYNDPTLPSRNTDKQAPALDHNLDSKNAPATVSAKESPYGDNWDVLWLGHCGALFPQPDQHIPQGLYSIPDDATVPLWKYNNSGDHYEEKVDYSYPEHTRVVQHARRMICTFAYAVSRRGARRLLYDLGVDAFHDPYDVALAIWCEKKGTCLTVQPQLISLYRAPGAWNKDSDIHPNGDKTKIRKVGSSPYIRQSVKLNMGKLVKGQWDNLTDQYPDDSAKKQSVEAAP